MVRRYTHTRNIEKFNQWANAQPRRLQDMIRRTNEKHAKRFARALRRAWPISDDAPHIRDAITVEPAMRHFAFAVIFGDAQTPYAAPSEFGPKINGEKRPGIDRWLKLLRRSKKAWKRDLIREWRKTLIAGAMTGGGI